MEEDTFTFDGHVSEEQYKPYVPWEQYATLKKDTILVGVVNHVTPGDVAKAQVLINGHLMAVPVWGSDAMKVRTLVNESVKVAFTGMRMKDGVETKYPVLRLML